MNISLDDKRIKKIVYQLEDGKTIEYGFDNGELVEITTVYSKCSGGNLEAAQEIIEMDKKGVLNEILKEKYGFTKKDEKSLSDKEMIDAVKKSEFMDELNAARKRFKIGKEIVDGFPEKDDTYREKPKRSEDKCSDESLEVVKEIIKMDKECKLDEMLKRHNKDEIGKHICAEVMTYNDSELADDSYACQKNMNTIEQKILARIRMNEDNLKENEEFNKLIDDYKFYQTKKKELDDKIWNNIPKVNV